MDELKPTRGRPRKEIIETQANVESTVLGSPRPVSFDGRVKIKFRINLDDGTAVENWYNKSIPSSFGVKCEAEQREGGVYIKINDYGWYNNETQYEGSEPIGEQLINRIGYDFSDPTVEKKQRKPRLFANLEEGIKAAHGFLVQQEKNNLRIENSPYAVQYNAPGNYRDIAV